MTLPSHTPELRDLAIRLEATVNKQGALTSGSSRLLAYGITSHVKDVLRELDAINTEIDRITHRYTALGNDDAADYARSFRAIIVRPAKASPKR